MADELPIAPDVFKYIDEFVAESNVQSATTEPLDADGNLFAFLDAFFAQFFQNVLRREITSISLRSAVEATKLLRREATLTARQRKLIRQFQHLCKTRRDLLGHAYGGGSSELSEFHFSFMPSLLVDIETWAVDAGFEAIRDAARQAHDTYNDFLSSDPNE